MKISNPFNRKPDFVIGKPDAPYMRRWWLTPRLNWLPRIYLHNICKSDEDRALHDHISWSISIVLLSGYYEHFLNGEIKWRRPGSIIFRRANTAHRIRLRRGYICGWDGCTWHEDDRYPEQPAWSIFIVGPKLREWGFHCPAGWRHWREFIGVPQGEPKGDEVGPGCS